MKEIYAILHPIAVLGLLGLTGFIAGKTKYLPENSGAILSRVVIKLTAPMLIVTTLANYSFDSKTVSDGITIYLSGIIFIFVSFLISRSVSSRLPMEESSKSIYKMVSMFGNVIFLAYPLLRSLYGEKGIVYAIFFNLANDTMLWTLGIYLVNKHNTTRWKDNLKHMVNGNTIAFVLGVASIIFNVQYYVKQYPTFGNVYGIVFEALNSLGHTTIYLSMVFIGLILAEVKIKSFSDLLKRYPIFILSFFKLVAVPALAFAILLMFRGYIDPFVRAIIVLQLAMPSGTIVAALANQYEADYKLATECIFITTILGIFTLPLMADLVQRFM